METHAAARVKAQSPLQSRMWSMVAFSKVSDCKKFSMSGEVWWLCLARQQILGHSQVV